MTGWNVPIANCSQITTAYDIFKNKPVLLEFLKSYS